MYQAILFLPLIGALFAGLLGRFVGARACEVVTISLMFVAAFLSWIAFYQVAIEGNDVRLALIGFISSGEFKTVWSIRVDTLTAVMLVVVNTVSSVVHLYSVGYMDEDPHKERFFAYLSMFTFAMLALVTSDDLLQLFFGWEGVGLASYLLIGFWYKKPEANAAAIKAFIVNRVGDFGFALGIFAIFVVFGAVQYDTIFAAAPDQVGKTMTFLAWDMPVLELICFLLFMGAMGKSAQFLLHTWLPDAMEGPTPVSALIHAATMVTAGVFMVARLSPLFELAPYALAFVAIVGATSAFFAATAAVVQTDIKRVIAYSTCSQLGYMFAAEGVGAFGAGMFHLFTHACFKALLFLCAGAVIHTLADNQDMRRMGGLRKVIPFTWAMMLIGSLALTAFPLTSGFVSKDFIIETTWFDHTPVGQYTYWMTLHRGLPHRALHLASHVHDLRGKFQRRPPSPRARPRAALDHGRAASDPRRRRAVRRSRLPASFHRRRSGRLLARLHRAARARPSRRAVLADPVADACHDGGLPHRLVLLYVAAAPAVRPAQALPGDQPVLPSCLVFRRAL